MEAPPVVCQSACTLSPLAIPVRIILSGAHTVASVPASAKGDSCSVISKNAVSIQSARITERIKRRTYKPLSARRPWKILPASVAGFPPGGVLTSCHEPMTPNPSKAVRSMSPWSEHASWSVCWSKPGQLQSGAACEMLLLQPVTVFDNVNWISVP